MRGFVVELSNGEVLREESILEQLASWWVPRLSSEPRPWILLRYYIRMKGLHIISLHLEWDHQGIFLPRNAKAYFYSHKVEGFLGANTPPTEYIGVGASEHRDDEVVITWYDGNGSKQETRKVDPDKEQFICR